LSAAQLLNKLCWRQDSGELDNGAVLVSNAPRGDPIRGAAGMPPPIEFSLAVFEPCEFSGS
jgi:hypothetical protein